ncbi:MAG TPA: phospholipid carrier-dependent glycosyltransferase [Steroidobacteraceae bacterium]
MSTRARSLWVLLALLWFAPLQLPHLFDPDEGRYAEIPREMVASGDWVTPRLDAIKYFEKPVLQYWATALAFRAFGAHAWSARLWPALCGFLGLPLSWALARRLYDRRSARLTVIVQAGALLYLALSRMATVDMSLSFGLQLAMCALVLLAQQRARAPARAPARAAAASAGLAPAGLAPAAGRWRLPALLGLGMAVAVLSKGLVGILIPGAAGLLYLLWRRDWTLPLRARPWWALLVLLVLAAPWFVIVSVRNPEFPHFFFIVQHFQRYLSRAGFDRYQPDWFFIPVLALGFLPWTTLLPGALHRAWRAARAGENGTAMLLIWAGFVFAFFSLSQSKLVPYILPMLPALAVLTGRHLAALNAARLARHLAAIALVAGALGLAILLLWRLPAAAPLVEQASTPSIAGFAAAFLLLALGSGAGALLARRAWPLCAAAVAAGGAWLLTQCGLLSADELPRMQALITLEQRSTPWLTASTRVYCVNAYWQPLPFYWRRTCTLVGYRGELDFGLRQEPWRAIADLQQFAIDWRAQRDALAVLRPEDYRQLQALGLPMRLIYTAQSLVAVVRR